METLTQGFKRGTHLGFNTIKMLKKNFFSPFNTSGNIILKMLKHFYRFSDRVLRMKSFWYFYAHEFNFVLNFYYVSKFSLEKDVMWILFFA